MKVPNNPNESECSITAERQRMLLIYPLYKTIHMDAVIVEFVAYPLMTVNDFHHFS